MLVGSRAIYTTELKNPAGYRKYLLLTLLSTFFGIVGFIGYSLGESYSSISILPLCLVVYFLFDIFQSVLIHLSWSYKLL